ncbi:MULTISPECIES: TonB-dependent receptor domain-containing protein [unclassified Brevundimonas]|uniref:TonB-dependent receptor domain-containing protein n=1 Tax=unclassified Brevundimonas TaxID=2622653 RepID=UPI002004F670|nr:MULTISPECIES: TonB-dependent receptor [unclassified Brevundimonas]MCK6103389.1 TonB-dependent receptor [Brevundimonas sp. EYE_349]
MNNTKYRRSLLATTIIGGAAMALAATPSFAQSSNDQATEVGEIVVTGSRIARQDYRSASPIVTVTSEDFQATGSVTIDSLLNDMPQFVPSINATSNNPSNGGQANLNLRGLGTSRTLVLMNGRRVVPSNASGVVDVNILPTALIKNVEVISGGASAAYGSDALAGVANFILDESFQGVQVDAQYGETDRSDGVTQSYSVTLGGNFADDRGNMVLSLGRSTRAQIYNAARDWAAISGASGTSPLGSTTFDSSNLPSQAFINSYFGAPTVCPTTPNPTAPCVANSGQFGFNNNGSLYSYVLTRNFQSPGGIDYDGFATPGAGSYTYNTGALNTLQLPLDRYNAYAGGRYKINENAEVYGSLLFTQYTAEQELAATPAAGNVPSTGFRVPATNPFIGATLRSFLNARATPNGSFLLNKRFNELGGRVGNDRYTVYQLTTGVRGRVPQSEWTYDIYAQYGRVDNTTTQTGNVSRSAVQRLLDAPDGGRSLCAGGFNPFGQSNLSAECINYIARRGQNTTISEQTIVEGSLQGKLFELPAGEARGAFGVQYRQDDYIFRPDAALAQQNPRTPHLGANGLADGGEIGGSEIAGFNASQGLTGTTNSKELFAEVLLPLLSDMPFIQDLDLTLGYRYSDYSSIGGVSAYKADLEWGVFDGFRLRGGANRAVRAPSIGELFAPTNTSFPSIGAVSATGLSGDPCDIRSSYRAGANATKVRDLCVAQGISAGAIGTYQFANNQVTGITGGNPNLEEETADTWSVGAVYQSRFQSPWLSGFSASLDYYNIEITNVIGTVGASAQLQGCYNAQGQNPTYDPNNGYCQLFQRDPNTGNVVQARELNQNLATLKTSGIDAQLDYRIQTGEVGLPDFGSLNLNVVVGWLENWERQDTEGGPFINRTGTIDSVFGNTFPEWKLLTSLNWKNGPFGAGVRWRRVGEMTQFGTTNTLDAVHYFDLNGSWAVNDTVVLRAGVNNLTDQDPNTYSPGVQANTDPSTYDVLGRRYYVGLTAKF